MKSIYLVIVGVLMGAAAMFLAPELPNTFNVNAVIILVAIGSWLIGFATGTDQK